MIDNDENDNCDNNDVDDDANDDTSDGNSSGAVSGSNDVSDSSADTSKDSEPAAPWVSIVAMANKNVEHGFDSDFIDSSPNDWFNLQSNCDFDAKGVYNNDDSVDGFGCMTNISGSRDE